MVVRGGHGGGGGIGLHVADEGTDLGLVTQVDFIGSGVSVQASGNAAQITVSGAGSTSFTSVVKWAND